MGNNTGKHSHGSAGSPLDFFHTAPTTPSEAKLAAMALTSSTSTEKVTQKGVPSPLAASSTNPSNPTPITEVTQKPFIPSEWAVISLESVSSPERLGNDAAMSCVRTAGKFLSLGSPASLSLSRSSPSDKSWQEGDSGLEPQSGAERAREEMTPQLLSLIEQYRTSLGLSPEQDATMGAVGLLRRLVTERNELAEELGTLKDTLRVERAEWHQFQCDLQVAVSVADRLRVEAEQTLGAFQESYRVVESQLAQALSRQREQDRELESLRAQYRDACQRLSALAPELQQQQHEEQGGKLDTLMSTSRRKDGTNKEQRKDSEEGVQTKTEKQEEHVPLKIDKECEEETKVFTDEDEAKNVEQKKMVTEKNGKNKEGNSVTGKQNSGDSNEAGKVQFMGKGVAEAYLHSLATMERKKEECGPKEPRKIMMLSERSWSLSRLPLPVNSTTQIGTKTWDTSTTLPLCKKEEPAKGRRIDHILQRQDSWSTFNSNKQDEDSDNKPQDGFSILLRRHGGSRRNTLLHWCQNRTQDYKNIEITNFSSSWEDGLAFCALYHTYLPSKIPYSSLNPANKRENLDLAFRTGESIGITTTLTVEEMLKADGPDWQRVLGYVESIFHHFEM